jgi:hypothetical protein
MALADPAKHRQQELYWQQLVQLKAACEYVRRYRNRLALWETRIGALRALASSSAIAAWAVVQAHPLLWGGIIAAAQVADALKDVFPLSARRRSTSELVAVLDTMFIETLHEWESVRAGQLSDREIADRWLRLMQRRHEVETKCLATTSLPERRDLMMLANADAKAYLEPMARGRRP